MTDQRPSWDEYFLQMSELAASRSTCLRRKVGAVLVSGRQVLGTGYNGSPRNLAHCQAVGCLRAELQIPSGQRHEICRAIHAEQNAILQAAGHGVAVKEATFYCTHQPCVICAKLILNLDVRRIVVRSGYPDELAEQMMAEAGFVRHDGSNFLAWEKNAL